MSAEALPLARKEAAAVPESSRGSSSSHAEGSRSAVERSFSAGSEPLATAKTARDGR